MTIYMAKYCQWDGVKKGIWITKHFAEKKAAENWINPIKRAAATLGINVEISIEEVSVEV